ncbi:MAG TPA: hypothetical protein DCQ98_22320 [Planctomycetaceae bacterium]|nr:hypothetical protein [Planctomycetaceae bacterium]
MTVAQESGEALGGSSTIVGRRFIRSVAADERRDTDSLPISSTASVSPRSISSSAEYSPGE